MRKNRKSTKRELERIRRKRINEHIEVLEDVIDNSRLISDMVKEVEQRKHQISYFNFLKGRL